MNLLTVAGVAVAAWVLIFLPSRFALRLGVALLPFAMFLGAVTTFPIGSGVHDKSVAVVYFIALAAALSGVHRHRLSGGLWMWACTGVATFPFVAFAADASRVIGLNLAWVALVLTVMVLLSRIQNLDDLYSNAIVPLGWGLLGTSAAMASSFWFYPYSRTNGYGRFEPWGGNPNVFGMSFLLTAVIGTYIGVRSGRRAWLLVGGAGALLTVMTGSRAAVVSLVIVMAPFVERLWRRPLLGLTAVAAAAIAAVEVSARLLGASRLVDAPASGRALIAQDYLAPISIHPLTGLLGTNGLVARADPKIGLGTHNAYLDYLYWGGLLLFALFIVAMLVTVASTIWVWRHRKDASDPLLVGVMCGLVVAGIFHSFTADITFFPACAWGVVWFLAVGVVLQARRNPAFCAATPAESSGLSRPVPGAFARFAQSRRFPHVASAGWGANAEAPGRAALQLLPVSTRSSVAALRQPSWVVDLLPAVATASFIDQPAPVAVPDRGSAVPSAVRGGTRAAARALAFMIDEALSSLQNFVIIFAALRYLSIGTLGVFTLVYTAALLVESVLRSFVLMPLSIRYSHMGSREQRRAGKRAVGAAIACGGIAVGLGVASFAGWHGTGRDLFPAAGLAVLALVVQEAWRVFFFTQARPWRAVMNDGLCLVGTVALVGFAVRSHDVKAPGLMILWAVGTGIGALAGVAQAGFAPTVSAAWGWLREHGRLGAQLAGAQAAERLASQVGYALTAVIAGAVALGQLSASRTLISPFTTVVIALSTFAVPEAARLFRRGSARLSWFVAGVSLTLAAVIGAVGIVLYLLPDHVGRAIVGGNWMAAKAQLLPILIWTGANALRSGPTIGMQVMERVRLLLGLTISAAVATLIAVCGGAVVAGASGAAWGFAVVCAAAAVAYWVAFLRVANHPERAVADTRRVAAAAPSTRAAV